ncbi:type II toxin-antitoxin system Phd/YefM family antitoxin [Dryocola sp. LX212]|jgi:antitoxin YefM
MQVITFSEARNRLKSVLDEVADNADITVITRRDAEDSVVMSLDYYNSLVETVHLLSSPANATRLMESIAQVQTGQISRREIIDEDE